LPTPSLRIHLVSLVILVLLPMVILAVLVGRRLVDEEQNAVQRGLRDSAHILARAVDQEIATSIAALEALAESDALTRGDLPAIADQLGRARDDRGWVSALLVAPDGMQLMNVARPAVRTPIYLGDREYYRDVMASGRPVVSNLIVGRTIGLPLVAVAVPVVRGGGVTHVLVAAIDTERLNAVLAAAEGASDWVRAIVDRDGVVIARTRDADRFVGQRASQDYLRVIGASTSGLYTATALEGTRVRGGFSRAPLSGWTVGVALPQEAMPSPTYAAIVRLGLPGLSLLVLSLGFAVVFARLIASPIRAASAAARQLATGGTVTIPSSGVREIVELGQSLDRSRALLAKREQRLRLVSDISAMLLHSPQPSTVVRAAFDRLARDLALDVYFMFLVTGTETLRLDSAGGVEAGVADTVTTLPFGDGVCGMVARRRAMVVVESARTSADPSHALVRALGLGAYAGFPLIADDELIGTLAFGTRTYDAFGPDDVALLQTIASHLAIALQRQRLLDTLHGEIAERGLVAARAEDAALRAEEAAARAQHAVDRLQQLQVVTAAGLEDVSLPELLADLLPPIRRALAAETATVLLLSADRHSLEVVASDGLEDEAAAGVTVAVGDGVAGRIAISPAGLMFGDLARVPVKSPILAARVRSLAGVPLRLDGELMGVLHVGAAATDRFTGEDLDFLRVVADTVAQAIGRVRLRAREREARAEAEAANRGKDEFLAMLGHELRNPLGAIRTACALLDRIGSAERNAVFAREVIARQVRYLARMVDDLLDVSRVMRGKIALDRRPVDLATAVQRHVDVLRVAGRLEAHRFSVALTPVTIDADPVRLDQIIGNLLTNALKYTEPGGTIEVSVTTDGDGASFRIVDSGIGIAPDLLPRVFDLFVQSERALDRAQGGLGIGLTLVRHLAEAHGARVTAESQGVGHGSTFTVWWPAPVSSRARRPAAAPAGPGTAGTRRVVVIEDNSDSREMLAEWLRFAEHEVYCAEDGLSGVALLHRVLPDVAFVDIGLPGLDGYEVASRFRAAPGGRAGRLIALTGYGQADDRERALAAGFDEHLVKPVDPQVLERVIAEAPVRTPRT
jgi:signal transduction histidine kinase